MIIEALILKKLVDETRTPEDNYNDDVNNEIFRFIGWTLAWPVVYASTLDKLEKKRHRTISKTVVYLGAALLFLTVFPMYLLLGAVSFVFRLILGDIVALALITKAQRDRDKYSTDK